MYKKKHYNKVVKIEPETIRSVVGEVEYPKDYILTQIIISPVLDTEYSGIRILLSNNYSIPDNDEDITLSSTNLNLPMDDLSITTDSIKIIGTNTGTYTAIYNILFVFERIEFSEFEL